MILPKQSYRGEAERWTVDHNAFQYDEKLEEAIFRVSENKQINLFE